MSGLAAAYTFIHVRPVGGPENTWNKGENPNISLCDLLDLRSQGPPTEVKIGKSGNDIFGVKKMPFLGVPSGTIYSRQIWRVTGRESGSPELPRKSWTSPEVPRTSPEVFGDFPGSSLTVEPNSNPEVPRKFPRLPRKFPDFPGSSPEVSRFSGKPDTLFWLTKTFSEFKWAFWGI